MQKPVLEVFTALVPLTIAARAGWTAWRQKECNDRFKQDLQLRGVIQAEKRAGWEEAYCQHKRRMEELTAFACWCLREWRQVHEVLSALNMTATQFEKWRPKTAGAYGSDTWRAKTACWSSMSTGIPACWPSTRAIS